MNRLAFWWHYQKEAEYEAEREDVEEDSEEESEEESEDEADVSENPFMLLLNLVYYHCWENSFLLCMLYQVKKKGHEALIEVDNPNRAKPKTLKARDLDVSSLCSNQFL